MKTLEGRNPTDHRLQITDLVLAYPLPDKDRITVLDIPGFELNPGASIGIMGPSGSGKTSLLYTLAGIELPQQGTVRWGNVEVNHLSSIGRDRWRQKNVGFVFQDIHLIPGLTALQNVLLPVSFQARNPSSEIKQRGRELLNRVGLDPGRTPVEKLSRGEMQRVAVARALIMKPPILLADEPTGSLDAATALKVAGILLRLCGEGETTLIMVSHDPAVMNLFPSRFLLKNSRLMKG